ncbi:MAG: site-2 protease family protein [Candidatus Thermoplasmatota archaeon]|jgi:Zn-dependent protease|nr:site-2 protease family protein [Candidatus Thermoplasmatota archaeon]
MATYTVTYKKSNFSKKELQDIAISVVTLSVALFLIIVRSSFRVNGVTVHPALLVALAIGFLMTITAFLIHEMSHKFTAIHYGAWSEFRMWPMGLVLTIITGLIGFLFALPGAVYFASYRNPIREGKIALAGPIANLVMGIALLPILLFVSMPINVFAAVFFLVYINLWLGLFNLVPIPPLDGSKVFAWNKMYWGITFSIAAVLVAYFFISFGVL